MVASPTGGDNVVEPTIVKYGPEEKQPQVLCRPTVGRIVHYGRECGPRAAVITEVIVEQDGKTTVGLAVLNPRGMYFCRAQFSEIPRTGCWSWPPR
jgi:hypothetical protein